MKLWTQIKLFFLNRKLRKHQRKIEKAYPIILREFKKREASLSPAEAKNIRRIIEAFGPEGTDAEKTIATNLYERAKTSDLDALEDMGLIEKRE